MTSRTPQVSDGSPHRAAFARARHCPGGVPNLSARTDPAKHFDRAAIPTARLEAGSNGSPAPKRDAGPCIARRTD
ncbi:isochorismatase, isochorismatase family domain protein [Burkholderia thailandensis]|nr:isochorismatase, isochorismatase family domain protein [Burkholderia thailandensis]